MARYTGPKDKISRRFGVPLFGSTRALEKRAYGPGQHGQRSVRRKRSEFAVALAEKQKLRFQYGLMERQFRCYFEEAQRLRGVTGETLLQFLELRLDNVIFRLGMGNTRSAARQYVNHGHVLVNGRRVDIPSYRCRAGDVITIKESPRSQQLGMRSLDLMQVTPVPDWVTLDRDALTGTVVRIPSRDEIDPLVNEQLVVELYSR